MDQDLDISLATAKDARRIAEMSRDYIEKGLGWSWTEQRVLRNIRDKNANVAVAREAGKLVGFVIANYLEDEAHIVLLAVDGAYRRRGVATALMEWIEETALVAGIGVIYLEARLINTGARKFYNRLGYREFRARRGRYNGIETGVQLGKDLWDSAR